MLVRNGDQQWRNEQNCWGGGAETKSASPPLFHAGPSERFSKWVGEAKVFTIRSFTKAQAVLAFNYGQMSIF